jgi:hypothetical protein
MTLVLTGSLVLSACRTSTNSAGEPKAATLQNIEVGEIAFVDSKRRFVLIDLQSNLYVPAPGVVLRSRNSSAETARLQVGSEQKRPFIAADIIDGAPEVGDLVIR